MNGIRKMNAASSKWFARLVVIVLLCCGGSIGLCADYTNHQLDADQVVSDFLSSLEVLRGTRLRCEFEVTSKRIKDYKKKEILFLDHGNLRLESKGGIKNTVSIHGEVCLVKDRYVQAVKPKNRDLHISSYVEIPKDHFERTLGSFVGADYFGVPSVSWRGKGHDMAEVLPSLNLVARRDTLGGKDVILLEGSSRDVSLRLWLIPSLNYCLKKIEYKLNMPETPSIDNVPSHSSLLCEYDEFQKVADCYLPRKIRVNSTTSSYYVRSGKIHKSKPVELELNATGTSSIMDSALKFELAMDIPEGTSVYMRDAPRLGFKWCDNKIVPVANESLKILQN